MSPRAEYYRAWSAANRERRCAYNRAWNEANRWKRRAYNRAYYQANKERAKIQIREWHRRNRDEHNARIILSRISGIPYDLISVEMVKVKGMQLQIKRMIAMRGTALALSSRR